MIRHEMAKFNLPDGTSRVCDKEIIPLIESFNKKGLHTIFSCQGYDTKKYFDAYILFITLDGRALSLLNQALFYFDTPDLLNSTKTTRVRLNIDNRLGYTRYNISFRMSVDMIEFQDLFEELWSKALQDLTSYEATYPKCVIDSSYSGGPKLPEALEKLRHLNNYYKMLSLYKEKTQK